MSYHGILSVCKGQLLNGPIAAGREPRLMEIGVDRGVSSIVLTAFLARACPSFTFLGIDVLLQEQVRIVMGNQDLGPRQRALLCQGNSLDILPKIVEMGSEEKFDIVMVDGDHNYHTVSRELALIERLIRDDGWIVCDDYNGRWESRDLFYAEREGYEHVPGVTPRVETERHGVRPAIDEWLAAHPEWTGWQPVQGEPIILKKGKA